MYPYDVRRWLDGDPGQPAPPVRLSGRNANWRHLDFDVLAMPDPWSTPGSPPGTSASMRCRGRTRPGLREVPAPRPAPEWLMHLNGALPAYEWNFDDVNPPVHVMAALRVFRIDGSRDRSPAGVPEAPGQLLPGQPQDVDGNNVFGGGFLGLDNISLVDRSTLPPGVRLSGGRHRLDGLLHALDAPDRDRAGAGERRLPGHGRQVLRDDRARARPPGPVRRGGRVLLRPPCRRWAAHAGQGEDDRGPDPAAARRRAADADGEGTRAREAIRAAAGAS